MSDFHALTVSKIESLTPNAVAVTLEVPEALQETFQYQPEQYITIQHFVGEEELRRSYSLCSEANGKSWTVGIKKMEGGVFSVYANEDLKVGDTLNVMPPQGHFVLNISPENQHTYLAFVAGSGITPVMAMIKTVLKEEPLATFVLAYGNQSIEETMFYKELEALKNEFPDRFKIEFFFSRKSIDGSFFGRIERSMVNYLLKNRYKDVDFHSYYLCGPEAMIDEVKETLLEKGVDEKAIHFELFSSKDQGELTQPHDGQTQITVTVDDETETFVMPQDKSVLEAVLEKDLDAPYSCRGGICSSCMAKLKEGKVEMRKNLILTDSELEEGYILTCQSHPTTPIIVVDYDDI